MNKKFIREAAFRGGDAMQKLASFHATIAGVGTLGSNLADTLSRQGFQRLRLIDMDRVEEHNVSTQIFGIDDIGALKVDAAKNLIYANVEIEVETHNKRIDQKQIKKLFKGTDLVVDALDNSASRLLLRDFCRNNGVPCLHVGMFEGYGEVVWNDVYNVPNDVDGDVCDVPLARNLAMIAVSIAAEEIVDFVTAEHPRLESRSITLSDLKISMY